MNVSPSLLYKNIRLNHALKLIKTGKYSITEVSEMCGYSSAKYFSAAFKTYFELPQKYNTPVVLSIKRNFLSILRIPFFVNIYT